MVCVNSDEIQLLSKRANLGELIHLDATPPDDLHLGTCIGDDVMSKFIKLTKLDIKLKHFKVI